MLVYRHKNPHRNIRHENQPIIDEAIDLDALREQAKTDPCTHGKVMWMETSDGRVEVRFDRPTGQALPVKDFVRLKTNRARANAQLYSLRNPQGRKPKADRGTIDERTGLSPDPQAA
jgi:hypothetical protein